MLLDSSHCYFIIFHIILRKKSDTQENTSTLTEGSMDEASRTFEVQTQARAVASDHPHRVPTIPTNQAYDSDTPPLLPQGDLLMLSFISLLLYQINW